MSIRDDMYRQMAMMNSYSQLGSFANSQQRAVAVSVTSTIREPEVKENEKLLLLEDLT